MEMMLSGLADATMAAASNPMFWSPPMKENLLLEDLDLVSVLFVMMQYALIWVPC